jgi:hypothetical protein
MAALQTAFEFLTGGKSFLQIPRNPAAKFEILLA